MTETVGSDRILEVNAAARIIAGLVFVVTGCVSYSVPSQWVDAKSGIRADDARVAARFRTDKDACLHAGSLSAAKTPLARGFDDDFALRECLESAGWKLVA